jgi:hypothetical protein
MYFDDNEVGDGRLDDIHLDDTTLRLKQQFSFFSGFRNVRILYMSNKWATVENLVLAVCQSESMIKRTMYIAIYMMRIVNIGTCALTILSIYILLNSWTSHGNWYILHKVLCGVRDVYCSLQFCCWCDIYKLGREREGWIDASRRDRGLLAPQF